MMEYTEQIMRYSYYRELCECFIKLAKDDVSEYILKAILYNGNSP